MNDLKVADIIEDSVSSFASPALLVRKKNGDYRMCIDYRSLNKNTVKDKFPIPLIDDQLERMYGNKYFTSLDLFSGYYQVVVDKECRELTAFVTQDGHYPANTVMSNEHQIDILPRILEYPFLLKRTSI